MKPRKNEIATLHTAHSHEAISIEVETARLWKRKADLENECLRSALSFNFQEAGDIALQLSDCNKAIAQLTVVRDEIEREP